MECTPRQSWLTEHWAASQHTFDLASGRQPRAKPGEQVKQGQTHNGGSPWT